MEIITMPCSMKREHISEHISSGCENTSVNTSVVAASWLAFLWFTGPPDPISICHTRQCGRYWIVWRSKYSLVICACKWLVVVKERVAEEEEERRKQAHKKWDIKIVVLRNIFNYLHYYTLKSKCQRYNTMLQIFASCGDPNTRW